MKRKRDPTSDDEGADFHAKRTRIDDADVLHDVLPSAGANVLPSAGANVLRNAGANVLHNVLHNAGANVLHNATPPPI